MISLLHVAELFRSFRGSDVTGTPVLVYAIEVDQTSSREKTNICDKSHQALNSISTSREANKVYFIVRTCPVEAQEVVRSSHRCVKALRLCQKPIIPGTCFRTELLTSPSCAIIFVGNERSASADSDLIMYCLHLLPVLHFGFHASREPRDICQRFVGGNAIVRSSITADDDSLGLHYARLNVEEYAGDSVGSQKLKYHKAAKAKERLSSSIEAIWSVMLIGYGRVRSIWRQTQPSLDEDASG